VVLLGEKEELRDDLQTNATDGTSLAVAKGSNPPGW